MLFQGYANWINYPDPHYSLKDVKGVLGKSITELSPLECTCTGRSTDNQRTALQQNHCTRAYFCQANGELSKIDSSMKKFWELEELSKAGKILLTKENTNALDIHVRSLLACHRMNIHQSISNLDMARERLAQTEKRPLKRSEKKNAYINTVCNIWKKDKESFLEDGIKDSLLLHNFIFFWMDKETTKNA